jgi:enoyl-CoA hydratase/carnithine racemase
MGRIDFQTEEHVATITIEGEGAENLLTAQLSQELSQRLVEFDRTPELYVCVVRGSGANFCGGSKEDGAAAARESVRRGPALRVSARGVDADVVRALKPVVAAVSGKCLDEGLVLMGRVSDIRIAGTGASFGFPGVRTGQAGDLAVRSGMNHQIPATALRWMIVAGQEMGAAEAHRVGLVNEVVADAEVYQRADKLAHELSTLAPLAIRGEKQAALGSEGVPTLEGFLYAASVGLINRLGSDVYEGVRAFNEKRKPKFDGVA